LNLGGLEGGSAPFQISAGALADDNTDNATQIAAAGNTSGQGTGLPDLLATINNRLFLFYSTTPYGYSDPSDFGLCAGGCNVLTGLNTPDGTQDWNSWTLATTQLPTGTALYLWNRTTGDLDLWTGLALDPTGTTLTTTGQYTVAGGWNTGKTRILQAADLAGTGIPDLWATDPATGTSTAYLPANLANNPTLTTTTTATTTANHAWDFQDIGTNTAGSTLTSTIDSIGTQNLTGTTGTVWDTGDAFAPDALLNTNADGTTPTTGGTGHLASASAVVSMAASFTVSAWVKPTTMGGVVLSQVGSYGSGFILYPTPTGWEFCMETADNSSSTYDCAIGATVNLQSWAYLTATYNATSKAMTLYVNGLPVAGATHTPVAGFTGKLQIGDQLYKGAYASFFTGSLSNIETWNRELTATQAATLAGDPGYVPATAGQWKLNDATGTVAADTSNGAHPATLAGGATWTSDSTLPGEALALNGSTGYAATSANVLDTSKSHTVSAWVKLNSTSANSTFVSQSDTAGNENGFQLYYSATAAAWGFNRINDDTTTAAFTPIYGPTTGPDAPHAGAWAQLTGVYDASTKRMYLYVNGTLVSSGQYTGTTWNAAGNLQIGRRLYQGAYGENASANLSQVRVWNSAFTPDQASALYLQGH
ncbi:LamG domain-containing protein, partial [Streptacidiphilus sp. N1-12]